MLARTITASVIMMGVALASSPAWSTSVDTNSPDTETRQVLQTLSVDEHLRILASAKQQFEDLENRIEKVEARIDNLTRKPYLDTKGFRRQGLRLRKGRLLSEQIEAANKIVWHETQVKEMQASRDKHPKDS